MAILQTKPEHQQPHCLFPVLAKGRTIGGEKRQRHHAILNQNLFQRHLDPTQLLQSAWGLVLSFYTDCDDIAFHYVHTSADETNSFLFRPGLHEKELDSNKNRNGEKAPVLRTQLLEDNREFNNRAYTNVNTALIHKIFAKIGPDHETELLNSPGLPKDLNLVLLVEGSTIPATLTLDYDTSIIDSDRAKSVVETFKAALLNLVNSPNPILSTVNACSGYDFHKLSQWNPAISVSESVCVHNAILRQCLQSPEDVAVDSWDGVLTYHEIDFFSAQLGQRLFNLGVTTDTLVPLCFEKSKWAIVAVLGVLRAGGAFAFLDPSISIARMASITHDLGAKYLVCSSKYSALGVDLNLQSVVVPGQKGFCQERPLHQQVINPDVKPHHLVYAAFSSGSTGRPKGALIEHGAFCARAVANRQSLSLGHRSRVLQFASYVFDVSNRDILYTLMFGGCVCVPSNFDRYHNLMDFMNQKQINWASLTPSVVSILEPSGLPLLRHLVLCGEAMSPLHIVNWSERVNLINAYGPSEAVTISSIRHMSPGTHHMNIGYGSGSNIWIVDQHDYERLLPIGAVGEMMIESPCVGRGYINNPELTEKSFLVAPQWLFHLRRSLSTGRIYKTGDLGQYQSDGSIRFMGRKDSQVKIRGQRVELSEVEHHIAQILGPDLDISVLVDVVVPRNVSTTLLVAFFSMKEMKAVNGDLKASLRKILPIIESKLSQLLPSYMVPSRFVVVEKIPMTATGKKDRRQLRDNFATLSLNDFDTLDIAEDKKGVPTSEMERQLQRLWASILKVEASQIVTNQSLFRLGGDSLSAMQIAALARSEGLELSVADILEHKRIDKLSDLVSSRPRIETALEITPFSLVNLKRLTERSARLKELRSKDLIVDIVPVTESQTFFLRQWSLSSFCLRLIGVIDVDRLRSACQTVVTQHSSLRSIYTELGDKLFQVFLRELEVDFNHVEVYRDIESACQANTTSDLKVSPISGDPLIKFTLISRSDTEHALMVRLSHAQYDGYSSPVLFKSLSAAYNHPVGQLRLPLPTPYSHYVYACHQHKTKAAFDFWRGNLQGSAMTVYPGPRSYCAEGFTKDIRQGVGAKAPIPPHEISVPTLMNAALSVVLSQILRAQDVVFGVVMNTRDISLQGVETMLGSCLNINPFRVRLSSRQTIEELCHSLHDQYVQVARYGYVDLPDIVAHSTDWARDTRLGFMINHLDGTKQPTYLNLNGARCESSSWKANINLPDQVLICSVTTRDELQVQVLTTEKVMTSESAASLAQRLVDMAHLLCKSPELGLSGLKPEE